MTTATPAPATPAPVSTNWGPILHPLLHPQPAGGIIQPANINPDFKALQEIQSIFHQTLESGGVPASNLKEISTTLFTPVDQTYTAFIAAKNELLSSDMKYIQCDLHRERLQEVIHETHTTLSNLAIVNMVAIVVIVVGSAFSTYFNEPTDMHKNLRYMGNTLIVLGTLCFTFSTYRMTR
jgi:hypothetical protein